MRKEQSVKVTVLIFSFLFSLFAFSCDNPFAPPMPGNYGEAPPPGKGAFFLSVAVDNPGRTILPPSGAFNQSKLAKYELVFTKGGDSLPVVEKTPATLSSPVYLDAGTYSLAVTAYLENGTTPVARGSAINIEIGAGGSVSRTITLSAIIAGGEGEGTLKYTGTFPTGLTTAAMKITPLAAGTGTPEQTLALNSTSITLKTGYYNVVVTLEKANGERMIWREILHIYANLESVFPQSFTNDDFYKTRYTVTFKFDDNGVTDDATQNVNHGGTVTSNQGTPARSYTPVAGLYQCAADNLPNAYTFEGWYNGTAEYNFSNTVTEDITLTAHWKVDGRIETVAANNVAEAFTYVNDNAGTCTLLLDTPTINTGVQTLNVAGVDLTIIGIGNAPTVIQYNGAQGSGYSDLIGNIFFTIRNSASLTLGNNITLRGISTGDGPLVVVVEGGTLTMKAGSKITGHTTSSPTGAVYIESSTFEMDGGEISGNKTTDTTASSSGGLKADGTIRIRGGTISGNTNSYGANSNPADIYNLSSTFTLSGNAIIGALMLFSIHFNGSDISFNASITIDKAYTGSTTALNLYHTGDYDSANINNAISFWKDEVLIKAGAGHTLSPSEINNFTLGKFISDDYTNSTDAPITGYYIETTGADIGKLLKNDVTVTGVTLNKTAVTMSVGGEETLIAAVEPANASNKNVTWLSSTPSVATVTGGVVRAIGRGTTTITVTTADGTKTATCTVTVYGGTGGETTPYEIWDELDLRRVGTGTDGWTLSVHYKLMEDIDLSGKASWMPIGNFTSATDNNPFTGSFDGNIKKITGLINTDQASTYQGMFGYVGSNARVKNLALVNVSISTSLNYAGGIAGYSNNALIENCSVSGTGNVSGNTSVGGVVGYNGGTVQNCYATSTVSGIAWDIGGVVGNNGGIVQNCYATGTVSGISNIGGVVGNNSASGTVQNCYATGKVTGDTYVGGVVGNNLGSVTNCVALNADIVITGTATTNGRVTGTTGGTRSDNYARNDMQKTGTYFAWPNKGASLNDGADITAEHYSLDSWWRGTSPDGPAFDFASGTWDWHSANKLPILNGFAAGTQNPKVTPHTTGGLIITVEEIEDLDFGDINGGTISRTGAGGYKTTLVLNAPTGYTKYEWTIAGVSPGVKISLSETSVSSVTVNANDPRYNSLGSHAVYLIVWKGSVPYSKTIWVTIVDNDIEEDFGAGASIEMTFNVTNVNEWTDAKTAIRTGGNGISGNNKNYIINVTSDFTVPGSAIITNFFGSVSYVKVALRGAGRTITLSGGNGNLIRLAANQTVILRDLTLQGHSDNNNSVVYVTGANSNFVMESGKITGNSNSGTSNNHDAEGGGVFVSTDGIFTMNGGVISGNKSVNGGGVYVINTNSNFTMNSGVISGNESNSGGGVYVYTGTVTMHGGVISGNTASYRGGGVYMNAGTFRIVTGTIYGSEATIAEALRNTATNSGGASLYRNNGTATYGPNDGTGTNLTSPNDATIRVVEGGLQ